MFHIVDWFILGGFLLLTTYVGHRLRGNNSESIDGFFRGGRNIPWWAVSTSLIATKTSALTFISVPAFIFAAGGNLTYAQITIGFALGNFLMAYLFLDTYYKSGVYSPYELFEQRLGAPIGILSRVLFLIGATLSQAVRLLSTALILSVVTGLDVVSATLIISLFAVLWAWLGGVATVIWTDFIQFILFIGGAIVVLLYTLGAVPGGLGQILQIADEHAKLALLDLSLDPSATFTLWVGLFGATLFELGANAVDQIVVQRSLCCKDVREAKKAVCFSAFGVLTTHLMLLVGLGVFAYYQMYPLPAETAAELAAEPDRIFPFFVIEQLPVGISGLIVAALFASGITTLDSALTALSQTGLQQYYRLSKPRERSDALMVKQARYGLIFWGSLLCVLALVLREALGEGLLKLGLSLPGYVFGSLLGIAWLARSQRKLPWQSVLVGAAASGGAVIAMKLLSVSFFWWYLVGAVVQVAKARFGARMFRLQPVSQ